MILDYILPPLLGVIIGYFTNMLAIQMLFRPYNKWYIGKMPIPFTPGIIPQNRETITRKIAIVGENLFADGDTWNQRLSTAEIKKETVKVIDKVWKEFYTKNHPTFATLLPQQFMSQLEEMVTLLEDKIHIYLSDYVNSHDGEQIVRELIEAGLQNLNEKQLQELLLPEKRDYYFDHIYTGIVLSEQFKSIIQSLFQQSVLAILNSNSTLNSFISSDQRYVFFRAFSKELPFFMNQLLEYIRSSKIKTALIEKIKKLIHQFIDEMGFFNKMMVQMTRTRSKIDVQIPEKVEQFLIDAGSMLDEEENREAVLAILSKYVDGLCQQPLHQLIGFLDGDIVEKSVNQFGSNLVNLLGSPAIKNALHNGLTKFYNEQKTRTIQSILKSPSVELQKELSTYLCEQILSIIRSATFTLKMKDMIHRYLHSMVHEVPIGVLSERLPLSEERQMGYIEAFAEFLLTQVKSFVIPALSVLDVQKLLMNRMEGLSIQRVEEMILLVIKKHFTYINIIGGVIGFFVGCIQVAFNQLFKVL